MNSKQIKKGIKVKISPNIELTRKKLSANPQMDEMSKDNKIYIIKSVTGDEKHGKIATVGNFVWMPEDLIDAGEGCKDPVTVAGKKETFDPSEI